MVREFNLREEDYCGACCVRLIFTPCSLYQMYATLVEFEDENNTNDLSENLIDKVDKKMYYC